MSNQEPAEHDFLSTAVYCLLAGHAAALFWASFSHRALFADGSHFFFMVFDSRRLFWDPNYLRIFSSVLQIPSLVYMWLSPGSHSTTIPALLYDFTINLHPIVSLAFCFLILKKYQKLYFLYFPILSFSLCTQSLMGYPSLIIPETLSLFWPLFLLLLFRNGGSLLETLFLIVLTFCLAFTYEAAILFFALNIFVLFFLPQNRGAKWESILLNLANFAGIGFMLWRLFGSHAGTKAPFLEALKFPILEGPFRMVGIIGLIILGLIIFLFSYFPSAQKKIEPLIFSLCAILVLFFSFRFWQISSAASFYHDIWIERTTVIPVAAAFAFLLAIEAKKNISQQKSVQRCLALLTCVSLMISFARDIYLTDTWRNGYSKIQSLRKHNPGCNTITMEAVSQLLDKPNNIGHWWIS